jgi:hypothetical protein
MGIDCGQGGQLGDRRVGRFGIPREPLLPPLGDSAPEQVDGLLDGLPDRDSGHPADRPTGQRPGAAAQDRDHPFGREVEEHVPPLDGLGHRDLRAKG